METEQALFDFANTDTGSAVVFILIGAGLMAFNKVIELILILTGRKDAGGGITKAEFAAMQAKNNEEHGELKTEVSKLTTELHHMNKHQAVIEERIKNLLGMVKKLTGEKDV